MNESKFFYLGKITRKFSFKGELIIFLDTDCPSTYYDLEKVYVKEDNSYLPYFISDISKYKTIIIMPWVNTMQFGFSYLVQSL